MARIGMLAGRGLALLAMVLAFGACDRENPTEPVSGDPVTATPFHPSPAFSTTFSGGIPFGTFHQPTSTLGGPYNGVLRNISAGSLLEELAAIRARGAKVVLTLAGSPKYYTTDEGYFDLGKWKARVDRYRGVNFSEYVRNGTIIGHYMIDEPNDESNWGGRLVPPAVLEDMARYSKQIWPNMATIVRVGPEYLTKYSGEYRYLDAAWAQYLSRRGDPGEYIRESVADAQRKGLALIIGINILDGGNLSRASVSASQLESWGSALLSSTYPCAFLSWQYDRNYMEQAGIQRAMAVLSEKARNRPTKSCLASGSSAEEPLPSAPPTEDQPIRLSAVYWAGETEKHPVPLSWTGAIGSTVDIYREGRFRRSTENDGRDRIYVDPAVRSTFRVKICETGSTRCSNELLLQYQ
jgi:hypothetical protein